MTLRYPRSGTVFWIERSRLWLGLRAIRRGFELYECILVVVTVAELEKVLFAVICDVVQFVNY